MKPPQRAVPPRTLLLVDHNVEAKRARLRGPQADAVASALPLPFTPARGGNAWLVDEEHLPDVYAWAQHRRLIVRITRANGYPRR
jgi:hypothetical protein